MKLTFTDARIENDGGVWLCLKVAEPAPARRFVMEQKKRLYDVEIREHREKRSLDANAYFWTLLEELAKALGEKKEDLYLQYVRDYGIFRDWTLPPENVSTFQTVWSKQGTGWPTEQVDYTPDGENVVIRAYYGSSVYNTKQMSRLIDAVVQDCQSVGIETMTPDKLALLKEEWGNARRD